MPADKISIVDIDLTPFSVGRSGLSIAPLTPLLLMAWFLVLVLIGVASVALAVVLGVLTLLGVAAAFVATIVQRTSSSTTGHTIEALRTEHRELRLPGFEAPAGGVVDAVNSLRHRDEERAGATSARMQASPAARGKARMYVTFGVLILVIGLPAMFALRITGALPLFLLISAVFLMFTRARRVVQPSVELVRRNDPRPPILFLRSFRDDKVKVKVRVSLLGLPSNQRLRLEEALGLNLRDFGPFLAVGEPGEGLPQLGAARAYLADDRWQETVVNWIRESQLIVMLCGPTHWIHWEMQNIIKNERLHRLLLLLPPGRWGGATRRRRERWDNIVRSLKDTPYGPGLTQLNIDEVLLVQFRPNGRIHVFRSASELAQDYDLAVMLAIHATLQGSDADLAPSTDSASAMRWTQPSGDLAQRRPRPNGWSLVAKIGLCGLIAAIAAVGPGMLPGLDRITVQSLRALIFALGVSIGAWLFYQRDGRFLGWFFACVAGGFFVASVAASYVIPWLVPRSAMRVGFVQIPYVITWLTIALGVGAALAIRFHNFRGGDVWMFLLGAGALIGLLAPLGFEPSEGAVLAIIRFTVIPWTLFAAAIGYGLSVRENPW